MLQYIMYSTLTLIYIWSSAHRVYYGVKYNSVKGIDCEIIIMCVELTERKAKWQAHFKI